MLEALTSVASLITRAPSIAPQGRPGPPRSTSAIIRHTTTSVLGTPNVPELIANVAPARPQSAPVISQVRVTPRSGRVPQLRARLRLAAVARIAFPNRV